MLTGITLLHAQSRPNSNHHVSKASEQAAGLATLPSDDFSGGSSVPMLPHTWTQGSVQTLVSHCGGVAVRQCDVGRLFGAAV
jgi:hypothetical protein